MSIFFSIPPPTDVSRFGARGSTDRFNLNNEQLNRSGAPPVPPFCLFPDSKTECLGTHFSRLRFFILLISSVIPKMKQKRRQQVPPRRPALSIHPRWVRGSNGTFYYPRGIFMSAVVIPLQIFLPYFSSPPPLLPHLVGFHSSPMDPSWPD